MRLNFSIRSSISKSSKQSDGSKKNEIHPLETNLKR